MGRLKGVRAVDAAGYTMTVETGLTLAEVQAVAEKANRLFPLSLPSEGSCQLGGNLGTNAGGVGVLAYGNTRQLVLGLEVVLADGRIWNGLKALKKDNTGYDLQRPVHRLGRHARHHHGGRAQAVSRARWRRRPPSSRMPDFKSALRAVQPGAGDGRHGLTAFEFMPRIVIDFVLKNLAGTREPFATKYPWYVLLEMSGLKADGSAEQQMLGALEAATEQGLIIDAAVAGSLAQARDFWRLREAVSEAQRPEGASIKHDVSVPVQRIPEFVERANALVEKLCPGVRPLAVRPLRRRQRALQRHPAGRHGARADFMATLGRDHGRRARAGGGDGRLDLGRARHRPDEARGAGAREERRRARPDAQDQGRVRSARAYSIRARCCRVSPVLVKPEV